MNTIYPVTMNGVKIGKATVVKQGLLGQIECRCTFPKDGLYRVKLCSSGETLDLGICVPIDGHYLMQKRIPLKKIPEDNIAFVAFEPNSQEKIWTSGEGRISVSMLKSARRNVYGGQCRLIKKD